MKGMVPASRRAFLVGSGFEKGGAANNRACAWIKKTLLAQRFGPRDLLIGVDGGLDLLCGLRANDPPGGRLPDYAVGDWDSLGDRGLLSRVRHVTLPSEKDRSDLFFAAISAIEAEASQLICLGVTGGRPDHHLATLMDLSEFSTGKYGQLKSIQAIGVEGEYLFLSGKIPVWKGKLNSKPKGQVVSFFGMGRGAKRVTLKGFKYALQRQDLEPSSRGLSNEVLGNEVLSTSWQGRPSYCECEVKLEAGQLLMIIPTSKKPKPARIQ